jgi:hypothetical protein
MQPRVRRLRQSKGTPNCWHLSLLAAAVFYIALMRR